MSSTTVTDAGPEAIPGATPSPRRRAWIGVALAVVTLLVVLASTPLLQVRSVTVEGVGPEIADVARQAAEGAALGDPLLRVDTDGVAEAVRSSTPLIADAVVERDLRGRLTVRVEPRRPVLAWTDTRAGESGWVDADGLLFKPGAGPRTGVPTMAADASLSRTERASARAMAAGVIAALPRPVRDEVLTVEVRTRDDIRMQLSDGRAVRFGSSRDVDTKTEVLIALLAAAPARVYDVSAPDLPTTTR
jgi:cell division septal protein FtsQ